MKIISLFLLISLSCASYAENRPTIMASIPPIASLVKNIVGNLGDVEIIQKTSSCPHYSQIKPSLVSLIKNADYLVFISSSFEPDFSKYVHNPNVKKIEISKFKKLRIERNNLHIWLDLDNVAIILENIKSIMIEDGFDSKIIEENYKNSLAKLNEQKINVDYSDILVVGNSLYYLVSSKQNNNFFELTKNSSLKKLNYLREILEENQIHCLIHDKTIEDKFFRNMFTGQLVTIDIENWGDFDKDLSRYFFSYIQTIYSQLSLCKKTL